MKTGREVAEGTTGREAAGGVRREGRQRETSSRKSDNLRGGSRRGVMGRWAGPGNGVRDSLVVVAK